MWIFLESSVKNQQREFVLVHDMRENLAIAKLYKLGMKSLAEVNLFRQADSLSKAISISLSSCGASLSEFQCFSSPEACFATYFLFFGAYLWQEQSACFMGLPSCFRVSGDFFSLLVERGDFAPLKICIALCLSSDQDETTEFPTTEYKTAKSTWLFWLFCCLDLFADPRGSLPH